jgi:hypothetical protein
MGWQFSLRGMFVVTGIVATCLAAGYYFPTTVPVLVLIGLAQAAIVFAGDWLVRPTNRRTLAIVVALSWLLFGSTFILIGVFQLYRCIRGNAEEWMWMASFRSSRWGCILTIWPTGAANHPRDRLANRPIAGNPNPNEHCYNRYMSETGRQIVKFCRFLSFVHSYASPGLELSFVDRDPICILSRDMSR